MIASLTTIVQTQTSGFHLTTTEVAFGVPIGVVLAAIISFLALRWSTNKTLANQQQTLEKTLTAQREMSLDGLQEQRRMATEARLWERRAEIYPGIIETLQQRNILFRGLLSDLRQTPSFDKIRQDHREFITKHMALMMAWPGDYIQQLWSLYFAGHRYLDTILDLLPDNPDSENLRTLTNEAEQFANHCSFNLILGMRAELRGDALPTELPEGVKTPTFLGEPRKLIEEFTQPKP